MPAKKEPWCLATPVVEETSTNSERTNEASSPNGKNHDKEARKGVTKGRILRLHTDWGRGGEGGVAHSVMDGGAVRDFTLLYYTP